MAIKARIAAVFTTAVAIFGLAFGAIALPSADATTVQAGTVTNHP